MPDMSDVKKFLADETGLAVISTAQADGRVLSSIANCAVVEHPITGEERVGLVSMGQAARLAHVRRGSEMTIAVRRGWNWVSVTGPADLIGPDDLPDSMDAEALRLFLRHVYQEAGGTHDDFDEYDRAMVEGDRVAMLVSPNRILGNLPRPE